MTAVVSLNPWVTTNASGSFNIQSAGFIQGQALDSPNIRNQLSGGWLANSETIPMWGGVGISEAIGGVAGNPQGVLGGAITRATNISSSGAASSLTGFSVFDQNYAAVNNPSSPVPLVPSYGSVHFYRLGSGARIAVQCSPNLINWDGTIITNPVSWDFTNQQLEPYVSTTLASLTSYTSGTGVVIAVTAAAHGLNPGDTFELNSVTGTGASGLAALNAGGAFTAIAGTTGTTLEFTIATGLTLSAITGGNVVSGGVLPVKVLEVVIGNCMTVVYNSVTNTASWNRSGNCAVIQL